jgi:hypothetical protein
VPPFPDIRWDFGPRTLTLAGVAELRVAKGLLSAEGVEMRKFLEAAGNTLNGRELAVVGPLDLEWFTVISREPGPPPRNPGPDVTWTEANREADGRDVVIHSVLVSGGSAVFRFELVTEAANAERSRAAFDRLRRSFRFQQKPGADWGFWAALLISIVIAALILRRRTSSRPTPTPSGS